MAKKTAPENHIVVCGKIYTIISVASSDGRVNRKTMPVEMYTQKVMDGIFCRDVLVQRLEGQWSNKKKSDLMVSIIKGRPIGSLRYTTTRKHGQMYQNKSLLDGLQRTNAICGFINNGYTLSKTVKPILFVFEDENGERIEQEIELAGKKFKYLPTAIQQIILDYDLTLYEYVGFTDEELDDIIYGINSGTAFKANQKLRLAYGTNTMRHIQPLADKPLWENVKGCNAKNDSILGTITRTLMIMTDYDYNNLSASEMSAFAEDFDVGQNEYTIKGMEKLIDRLNNVISNSDFSDEEMEFFNACNVPHIISILDEWTGTDKQFAEYLKYFLHSESFEEYNRYAATKSGSGAKQYSYESVTNRHSVIYNAMIDYIVDNNIEGDEDDDGTETSDRTDDIRDSRESYEYGTESESEKQEQLLCKSCEVSQSGESDWFSGYRRDSDDSQSSDSTFE